MPALTRDIATAMPLLAALVLAVAAVRALTTPADRVRSLASGLALGAEFLVAGGLLRLSALGTLQAVGLAAAAVGVRTVIGFGLRRNGAAAARSDAADAQA